MSLEFAKESDGRYLVIYRGQRLGLVTGVRTNQTRGSQVC